MSDKINSSRAAGYMFPENLPVGGHAKERVIRKSSILDPPSPGRAFTGRKVKFVETSHFLNHVPSMKQNFSIRPSAGPLCENVKQFVTGENPDINPDVDSEAETEIDAEHALQIQQENAEHMKRAFLQNRAEKLRGPEPPTASTASGPSTPRKTAKAIMDASEEDTPSKYSDFNSPNYGSKTYQEADDEVRFELATGREFANVSDNEEYQGAPLADLINDNGHPDTVSKRIGSPAIKREILDGEDGGVKLFGAAPSAVPESSVDDVTAPNAASPTGDDSASAKPSRNAKKKAQRAMKAASSTAKNPRSDTKTPGAEDVPAESPPAATSASPAPVGGRVKYIQEQKGKGKDKEYLVAREVDGTVMSLKWEPHDVVERDGPKAVKAFKLLNP